MRANKGLRTRRLLLAAAFGVGMVFIGGLSQVGTMHRAPAVASATDVSWAGHASYSALSTDDMTWG